MTCNIEKKLCENDIILLAILFDPRYSVILSDENIRRQKAKKCMLLTFKRLKTFLVIQHMY